VTSNRDPDSGRPRRFAAEVAASIVQVELISSSERAEEVAAALAAGHAPADGPESVIVPLTLAGLYHLQRHADDLDLFIRAATDFRAFLDLWQFTDQESGQNRTLGEVLWPAQEEFVRITAAHRWVYVLKARKLGETTIACAFDAWVLRFRDRNARVHLFSRREDAARELLAAVKGGLERLPAWLQLPVTRSTAEIFELGAGRDDRRIAKAYPADNETAVENSCTHGHIDEWARMGNPRKVWQAIEPTMAGSCHIVTTGLGPTNYSSIYWRRSQAGDTRHQPCFIGVLERPDRTQAWLSAQRRSMDDEQFRQEYPQTWEDALSGGGVYVFKSAECELAAEYARGIFPSRATFEARWPFERGSRKYIKAWDIGRHQDAAVGIVLEVTTGVHQVVGYERLRGQSYATIQQHIERMHAAWPGLTVIEDNAMGAAVRENLDIPEEQLRGFQTTKPSKARIIAQLKLALQNQTLKWNPRDCPQLDAEMRGYQLPDDNVVQDSVIALAIAEEYAPEAHISSGGRILGVYYV
jgi:hypothetical protein